MSFDWTLAKDAALLFTTLLAVGSFVKGIYEYTKQGRQKRVEYFLDFNRRFGETECFRVIRGLLEVNDPKLVDVPLEDRREYAGFLEEAAILTNSGIIRPEISLYFFGYYAIDCWESEYFWIGLEREAAFWNVLRNYVEQLRSLACREKATNRIYRF